MTTCRRIYSSNRIAGHPAQFLTTALLIKYLSARYPRAWQLNGRQHLLRHIRNLDIRNAA